MLNGIKNLINSKKEFTEAADLILEGTSLASKLDDTIVLGEESEPEIPEEELNEGNEEEKETSTEGENEEETPSEPENIEDSLIEDTPAEPAPVDDDVLNSSIDGSEEQPMPLPGNDLPTPVGKQTGEPINDTDILSTEIDLGSNTMKDVLPVPPGNAPEAVNDDILNQRIDDGFGDENDPGPSTEETPENPMGAPTEPIPAPAEESSEENTEDLELESTLFDGLENLDESTKKEIMSRLKKSQCKDGECDDKGKTNEIKECDEKMVEGFITMSDDDDEVLTEEILMSGDDSSSDEKPAEGTTDTGDSGSAEDTPDEGGEEENPVTAAVKDKVAETEAPLEAEATDGSLKETLMKKLASMSKNMEDVKLQVSKLAQ